MSPERTLWEIRNEKNKAGVRWLIITAVAGYLLTLWANGEAPAKNTAHLFNTNYIFSTLGFALCANTTITWLVLRATKKEKISGIFKYLTMAVDFLMVTLVLLPTGGSESMLYPLYYVVIVSNALRYGMKVALVGIVTMNAFYVAMLGVQYYPQVEIPGYQQEALKIAGFWVVGIYTGYLARRFEILRGEVERYQKLLAQALQKNA
ncbi:MAG: hypothetical protein N2Z22_01790 [Turneriella sp.]|nr:hypothetical protein [Turneriella sp.]